MPKNRRTMGLALGGGSVRGLAHIGILKVLDREGIKIDYLAGTSSGALIAACYASGMSAEELEKTALTTEWEELVDFTIPKAGFIVGNEIENYIRKLTKDKTFSQLKIPLAVVATDIEDMKRFVIASGNVAKAVRASISIPVVFNPVEYKEMELVDGVLTDPVPVDIVREMGADVIIAVDLSMSDDEIKLSSRRKSSLSEHLKDRFVSDELFLLKGFLNTIFVRIPRFMQNTAFRIIDILFEPKKIVQLFSKGTSYKILHVVTRTFNIMTNELVKEKLKDSNIDLIIKPNLHGIRWAEFDKAEECIKAGERVARKALPKIKKLIN